MEKIVNIEFEGERPLYHRSGLYLEGVTIHKGESSVKECTDVECVDCRFEGKYTLWCCDGFKVRNCFFTEGARSSLWHTYNCDMQDSVVEAPKMFREAGGIKLRNVNFLHAQETFWSCSDIEIENVEAHEADYIFEWCNNVKARNLKIFGNYSFQHAKNVEIWDSDLQSKDALWECENVTVYNSFINGEYLAWHSKNVRLVNCRIGGEQALCYADGLVLENCTFEPDVNLAFEYSDVHATINGDVVSIKNPRTGSIKVNGKVGEIILNDDIKAPGDCVIETL